MVTLTGVLAAAATPADISKDESVEGAAHATQTTGSFPAVPPPMEYPVGPLPGRTAHTPQTWPYGLAPYVPHPKEIAMDPVTRHYIQEQAEMAMPNFVAAPPKGNILLDMRIKGFIPRPHMYIDQEGCVTIKEKLDYRNKMSYQQYMCAFTTMQTLVPPEDRVHLIDHLQQVCQDAMDRPWPAVLKWSNQTVFDRLERADITWRDREEIYYDRLRLSLSAHTEAPSQQTAPCPAFNAGMCRSTAETQGRYDHILTCLCIL